MRFKSFHIKNYKGISDCRIDFDKPDPRVIALIGLNESGKTTILEAISHFVAGDRGLQRVYGIDTTAVDKSEFIPKTKQMNFNDDIVVAATLTMNSDDFDTIEKEFLKVGYKLVRPSGPIDITVEQRFKYTNSTYQNSSRSWSMAFKAIKSKGSVAAAVNATHPCWRSYYETTEKRMAQICYFPTFLFDVPDKIFLEDHTDESPLNAYYRKLIQDILDSLGQGISLQTHVVDRVKGVDGTRTWSEFAASDERAQVTHVLNSAAAKITQVIMQSWKRVFKKDFDNKRIEIEYEIDNETTILCLTLYVEDFPERYRLKDRSLGFQWFFCFWLFTHFRTLRADRSGVIFLLDEPAANLHATAQAEILNSLGKLAYGENVVMYSTHSHYLINPAWLDRAFIISNGTGQDGAVAGEFSNRLPTAVSAMPYRQFARKHASQRTYYLPILDALDYKPSELTLSRPSLIVEGKADAAFFAIAFKDVDLKFSIVPAGGAMSMGPLLSLLSGWGFPAVCLLDDDGEGRSAVSKYTGMSLINTSNLATLSKFGTQYAGLSLEELIIKEWGGAIKRHFGAGVVNKELAQMYIYESFASNTKPELTPGLRALADGVLEWANVQMRTGKKRKVLNK
jgi:predicted ATP-dependent endonuclease of OLD family